MDEVSEMKHTKTFVHEATNELMLGKRESAWNAFRCFVRVEGMNTTTLVFFCVQFLLGLTIGGIKNEQGDAVRRFHPFTFSL